jgi:glycosyltransferase involved in cell wall biosynthesis
MNTGPFVTAVIPTYRRAGTLPRAIRSALNQTYERVGVLVFDDDSGDGTEHVVRSLDDGRITYRKQPVNRGYAQNTSDAVSAVSTEYFSILADDDMLLPDFYTTAVRELEASPDIDFCFGAVLSSDASGNMRPGRTLRYSPGLHWRPTGLLTSIRRGHANWAGVLFRRRVLDRVGPLDPTCAAIDFDFQLRCAARCSYAVVHSPVAIFTVHPGSISAGSGRRGLFHLIWPSQLNSIHKIASDEALPAVFRDRAATLLRNALTRQLFLLGIGAARAGDEDLRREIAGVIRSGLGRPGWAMFLGVSPYLAAILVLRNVAKTIYGVINRGRQDNNLYANELAYYRAMTNEPCIPHP